MPTNITLDEFELMLSLLGTISTIGLLEPYDYMVTWEKRPQLLINKLGDFEFQKPEEVYGCVITFWSEDGSIISKRRFFIGEQMLSDNHKDIEVIRDVLDVLSGLGLCDWTAFIDEDDWSWSFFTRSIEVE